MIGLMTPSFAPTSSSPSHTVSAHLNTNRSSQQCLHRWRYSLAPGKNKGRWDNEEDDALKRGVELCGVGNWSRIASVVQTRNAVQCRERWMNVLDSNIQRGAFTRQEDAKLLEICQQYEGECEGGVGEEEGGRGRCASDEGECDGGVGEEGGAW